MTDDCMVSDSGSMTRTLERPYSSSWANRLTCWVDRLPAASWIFYLAAMAILALALHAAQWLEGVLPLGVFSSHHLFMPAMVVFNLVMIHYLDHLAGRALESLRPALSAAEEEVVGLRYRLTRQPLWPSLLFSVATVCFILLLEIAGSPPAFLESLSAAPVSHGLSHAVYYLGWWSFGALLHHIVHQLVQINHIYTEHTRVSLFRMAPLYAFSSVSAASAVSLAVPTYGWTALNPENLSAPVSVVIVVLITALAAAAFVWPLVGIHNMLVAEKGRLLDQVTLRLEATMRESHQCLDEGKMAGIEELNNALTGLDMQRQALQSIPTWPWQPETVRLLITALALPLGLWIAQYVLQRVLGS